MRRWSKMVTVLLLSAAAVALAEEPAHPGQLFSSDLVSWSYMQEPEQPERQRAHQKPEPTPETQPSANPAQAGSQPVSPPAGVESQATETFLGIIDKERDSYVLKVSGATSYKLDNEHEVEQYEGRRVRVTGRLDRAINLIHVEKVEPLSDGPRQPSARMN